MVLRTRCCPEWPQMTLEHFPWVSLSDNIFLMYIFWVEFWYPCLTIFFSREYFGLIFNILVWQFFHGNLLGWMLLFLIPTRIQTRRLQGWISQSYVIFGHHHTPRLVRLFNILTDNVILCSTSCKYMSQKYFYHCCKVACKMRLGNKIMNKNTSDP